MRTAYIIITTWVGTVANGIHFYGKIKAPGVDDIEIRYKISTSDAKLMNRAEAWRGTRFKTKYVAGEESGAFLTEPKLIEAAVKLFNDSLKPQGYELLLKGDNTYLDPREMLIGPPDVMEKANKLHQRYEDLKGWECRPDEEPEIERICRQWDAVTGQNLYKRG